MRKIFLPLLIAVAALFVAAQTKPKQKKPAQVDKASVERGKKVYETYCLPCHQANGTGVPQMNPPLIKTKWVLGDKKQLIAVVLNGMDEEVEINGQYYSNTMAAHGFLKDEEIADVLTYVRNSFGNRASGVTPAEVKKVRQQQGK